MESGSKTPLALPNGPTVSCCTKGPLLEDWILTQSVVGQL